MLCPNCHGNIPENSKFCTLCGAKIPAGGNTGAGNLPKGPNPGGYPASASMANAGRNIVNNIDFHHMDLKGLITLEAFIWIIPALTLLFPTVDSEYSTGQGLLFEMFNDEFNRYAPTGVKMFFWLLIVMTILMVINGFTIAVLGNAKTKYTLAADYGTVGIIASFISILYGLILGAMNTLLPLLGGSINLLGHLGRIAAWVLLVLHCWQIWMMAVQNRRLN